MTDALHTDLRVAIVALTCLLASCATKPREAPPAEPEARIDDISAFEKCMDELSNRWYLYQTLGAKYCDQLPGEKAP